jgi:hypothetical protein
VVAGCVEREDDCHAHFAEREVQCLGVLRVEGVSEREQLSKCLTFTHV